MVSLSPGILLALFGKARLGILGQVARVLDQAIASGENATVTSKKISAYFSSYNSPRRDAAGIERRRGRPGQREYWPAFSGMASDPYRRIGLTETSKAHGERIRQRSAETGNFVRWVVAPGHEKHDICDDHAQGGDTSLGLGRGVFRPENVPAYPSHPRCFPAGVMVSGPPVIGSFTRWYEGELIEIVTAAGHFLPVTPNHPILTSKGWFAAGLLQEGDNVICGSFAHREDAQVNPNDYHIPALIEDVAVTLRRSSPVSAVRMPTSAVDFHGDGMDAEVCVIRTNGLLQDTSYVTSLQPFAHENLVSRNVQLLLLASDRGLASSLPAIRLAALSGVGTASAPHSLFGRNSGDHQAISFSDPANLDAGQLQTSPDGGTRSRIRLGERVFGLSGEISIDDLPIGQAALSTLRRRTLDGGFRDAIDAMLLQEISDSDTGNVQALGKGVCSLPSEVRADHVISIKRRRFSGHVYNLETLNGWYIANGIITHNCRCILAAVDSRATGDARYLGFEIGFDLPIDPRS